MKASSKSKLRLGPLPKAETVKVTISLSCVLKQELDRYAAAHAKAYGEPVEAVTLIPHMLQAFIERDRGFKQLARNVEHRPHGSADSHEAQDL